MGVLGGEAFLTSEVLLCEGKTGPPTPPPPAKEQTARCFFVTCPPAPPACSERERQFCIDNILVQIHHIISML